MYLVGMSRIKSWWRHAACKS